MTLLCVFGYILYDNQDKWLFLIISDQPTTTPAIEIRENKTIQDNKPTASTDTRPINIQKAQNHQILEDAKRSIKNDKCLENEVAEICQIIKATKNRNYYEGAVILNNTLHIVVDFNASYNHFQKYAPKYSKEEEFKALNLLLANPQHYRSIYELKRTGKEVNLYEYQSNIDAKDLKKMSDAIIYAELLFSKLAEVINKSKFDKITFVLYQVNGLDYNYINHWHFDRKFLLFKGHNMENLLFLTKVAIFHGELNNFNSINRNITSEIIR